MAASFFGIIFGPNMFQTIPADTGCAAGRSSAFHCRYALARYVAPGSMAPTLLNPGYSFARPPTRSMSSAPGMKLRVYIIRRNGVAPL
jgi:hypothetical protein